MDERAGQVVVGHSEKIVVDIISNGRHELPLFQEAGEETPVRSGTSAEEGRSERPNLKDLVDFWTRA